MTVSGNVQQETLQALRESSTQTEAAGKLGISQPALYYRLKHDPILMEEAVRKGFIRGKEIPLGAPTAKRLPLSVAPTSDVRTDGQVETQAEAPVIEHDRVFEGPEPLIAFKGAVVFFGEKLWVDVRVERR